MLTTDTTSDIIHKSWKRGHTRTRSMDSYHTFSFGNFFDAKRMGFRCLQVINDNYLCPKWGFTFQSHSDMEIMTYVMQGTVKNEDSMGNESVLEAGEVGIWNVTTGTGFKQSNPLRLQAAHYLKIWIPSTIKGQQPKYQQRRLSEEDRRGKLLLIADPKGSDRAIAINQDVEIYSSILEVGDCITYNLRPHRHAWLQVARGAAIFNNKLLTGGDGVQISSQRHLKIKTESWAEILLFDMA